MLPTKRPSERQVLRGCEELISEMLPTNWTLNVVDAKSARSRQIDARFKLTSPDRQTVSFAVEVTRSPTTKSVLEAVEQLNVLLDGSDGELPLIVSSYLSVRTKEVLKQRSVNFVDTTGNLRLASSRPGLFIEAQGATKDPWPDDLPLRSLRGRGAGRAVRALVDTAPPYGVRELSARTSVAPATLSRVIDLFERDAIITRDSRGGVTSVDWEGALKRWSQDYELSKSNTIASYLEPRGIEQLSDKLGSVSWRYAATSSMAAQRFAPVAPVRTVVLYVDDTTIASDMLGVRPAGTGANLLLVEPFDDVVFERTMNRDGLVVASPSQVAVDLMTGPGREPAESEAMLNWMKENLDAWRS